VAQFNVASSHINTGTTELPLGSSPRSAFAWVYWTGSLASGYPTILEWGDQAIGYHASGIRLNPPSGYLNFVGAGDDFQTTFIPTPNTWVFVGYTYNGGTGVTVYYNGQSQTGNVGTVLNTVLGSSNPSEIGIPANYGVTWDFPGSLADVQIYNTSLSANDVQALHKEGIGGEPILSDGLVGWWALNGNTNDTSGNLNNGQASGVGYTSFWTNGYAAP